MTQVSRTIRINTAATSKRVIVESAATTWGELKAELVANPESKASMAGDIKVLVRETKTTLEHPGALLPNFDFQLFITTQKSKGGALNDAYSSMDEKQLNKEAKSKGIKPGSTIGNTRVKLRNFDKKNGVNSTSTKAEIVKKPKTAKKVTAVVTPVVVDKIDKEVEAKVDKKAKKAAKKAAKQAKKDAKNNSEVVAEVVAPEPVAPLYDVNADLDAISKATTAIKCLEDNRQPHELTKAIVGLEKTSETTIAVSNLVKITLEKVRTYEFAEHKEING